MEVDHEPPRPSKRVRPSGESTAKAKDRRLFAPFRALGIVTNAVTPAIQTRSAGKAGGNLTKPSITIVTSLGKSWAMWDLSGSMRLLFVGPQLERDITSIVVEGDSVFAAAGAVVYQFIRGKQVASLSTVDDHLPPASSSSAASADDSVSELLVFGKHLLGLSASGCKLFVWSLEGDSFFTLTTTIHFERSFVAKKVMHPATYLNKVVVASQDGRLQIWNIASGNLIHEFSRIDLAGGSAPKLINGTSDQKAIERGYEITCVVQSPAIDVLAIGFASGRILVYDIKVGETLLAFTMSSTPKLATAQNLNASPITSLSFRTDNQAQTLASSDGNGNIALWDLDNGSKLSSLLRNAHDGLVGSVSFLPGQPVLVSTGEDNAIRQWFFETPTSVPRLLKERSGHHSPPTTIRYYGSDGKALLTASKDDRSLRYTSIVRDSRSFELSQGAGMTSKSKSIGVNLKELKLSGVSDLSFSSGSIVGSGGSTSAKKEFDDVLSVHGGDEWARTWSVQNKKMGKNTFVIPDEKERQTSGAAKASCVTACGNFGLVGYERTKSVHMWNMQSGIHRRSFKLPQGSKITNSRARHVTGIETDALNTVVVVATLAGDLHFFDFHSSALQQTLNIGCSISSTLLQRDNNLLALVCDDFTIKLLDIETKRVIREFFGFRGRIVDIAFSNDSRWLVASSTDSLIRTFDISTSQLIDVFKTTSIVSSLTFSPTGDFLATSMVDSVGIYLWTNRAQFADVSLRTIDEEEYLKSQEVVQPTIHADSDAVAADELDVEDEALQSSSLYHALLRDGKNLSESQLSSSLVTLSLLPRSKWQTLINLETITQRNKPKEPPKAPEQAPFFLPTLNGTEIKFDTARSTDEEMAGAEAKEQSRRLAFGGLEVESDLIKSLRDEDPLSDYESFFKRLFALSPASLDLEIRSLANDTQLVMFLKALTARLKSRKDFEAIQAILRVFLTVHSEALTGSSSEEMEDDAMDADEDDDAEAEDNLQIALREMLDAQVRETKNVGSLVRTSMGLVAWARGVPVV